ncbi:MAG: hypothetical protein A3F67_00665 [Verrucomicrobia bacterium RIFCSPHIGHO2_12_FULL_41_10]|nr:MAG: hypothetical protein A3F67_00665 [Verrucomicrobia bacterium RIFCSPHIGHO2_12_FULL_41_10]HLB34168.1 hypothetical protein [Chthoniobacterales bacterium]
MTASSAVNPALYHKNTPLTSLPVVTPSEAEQLAFQKSLEVSPSNSPQQQNASQGKSSDDSLSMAGGPTGNDKTASWNDLQKAMVNNIIQDGNRQASNFRMRLKEIYNDASAPPKPKKV